MLACEIQGFVAGLEQRHLRGQLTGDGHEPHTLSSEEEVQVAAQPLLRLAVVAELPLQSVELAVVRGASHMVYVLVMDDRLDEERRNVRGVQDRMDADLARDVVVRAETNGAAILTADLLPPEKGPGGDVVEIGSVELAGQPVEVMRSR